MKLIDNLINLLKFKESNDYNFVLPDANASQDIQTTNNSSELEPLENITENVYTSIDVNLEYVKVKYNVLINSDIKLRNFFINAKGKQYSAFLLYIDGMIDSESINKFVIEPLMLKNISNTSTSEQNIVNTAVTNNAVVRRVKKFNLIDYISECLVPENDVSTSQKFDDIFQKVNAGLSALFIDTIDTVFLIDAKGFETRSIAPPKNEIVIRGPQEGFVESIRTNTSLLRRFINNENFIIEDISVRYY